MISCTHNSNNIYNNAVFQNFYLFFKIPVQKLRWRSASATDYSYFYTNIWATRQLVNHQTVTHVTDILLSACAEVHSAAPAPCGALVIHPAVRELCSSRCQKPDPFSLSLSIVNYGHLWSHIVMTVLASLLEEDLTLCLMFTPLPAPQRLQYLRCDSFRLMWFWYILPFGFQTLKIL